MIKSNPLAVALVTALFLLALTSSWFSFWWFLGTRELQGMKYQLQSLNRISAAMQGLINDTMEYSRRNPAIDPVLQQFELKPRQAASPNAVQPPPRPAR
jgi:hypothetical protein